MPTLAYKINYITHCMIGDSVLTVISSSIISFWRRDRYWILTPTARLILLFTSLGWLYTFDLKFIGLELLNYTVFQLSWLPLLQRLILPPVVLIMTQRHLLGYRFKD